MAQTQLATLRSRLNSLRRRRATVRLVTAWSATLLALLWSVTALFLVDWLLEMSVAQRIVGLLIVVGVTTWAALRYTRPWIGRTEDVLDVALLVERHQHIDSDLIAALEFQSEDAKTWGSPKLEQAVIDYVEEFSPSLNVFEGFSYRRFKRRTALLAGTLAVLLTAGVLFPDYARAFAGRILLGSMHYPTDTLIDEVQVNGRTVLVRGGEAASVTVPYGEPLNFLVRASGELPEGGSVRLVNDRSGARVERELVRGLPAEPVGLSDQSPDEEPPRTETGGGMRSDESGESKSSKSGRAIYHGQLPKLVAAVWYEVRLGDARTDRLRVEIIPQPVVTVDLVPRPPEYATLSESQPPAAREGTRQVAVVEGSSVDLRLECTNKPLKRAWMTVDGTDYPLRPTNKKKTSWRLAGEGSPLHEVTEPVHYAVQVEDTDGLTLERPIDGHVRIRADRRPTLRNVALGTVRVLPTARQVIAYAADDDYGLSAVEVKLQIARTGGEMEETTQTLVRVPTKEQPRRELAGNYTLDLEPFGLEKGDEIKLTLVATDYRGGFQPQSNVSEPLVMQVTDVQGILAALGEGDEKAAQGLNTIIELGTGDKR